MPAKFQIRASRTELRPDLDDDNYKQDVMPACPARQAVAHQPQDDGKHVSTESQEFGSRWNIYYGMPHSIVMFVPDALKLISNKDNNYVVIFR